MDDFVSVAIVILLVFLTVWIYVIWRDGRRTRNEGRRIAAQSTLISSSDRARALCRAIHMLHPSVRAGVDFVINTDEQKGTAYLAEWRSPEPRPTDGELADALAEALEHGEDYAERRLAEYPKIGDQLDAAYKARHGDPAEQIEIDRTIKSIKDKYPRPDTC